MKTLLVMAAAVGLIVASTDAGMAATATKATPGHIMQSKGSQGASRYAPGHVKKKYHSTSAAKFAPGHPTK